MRPTDPDWDPLSPDAVSVVLSGLAAPWWIAGGWAIDLHLGYQSREHADIDVLVLRDDQLAVQRALPGWDLHAADPPGTLRPWLAGETLPATVHDVWCRRDPNSPWCLQIMVDDANHGIWRYRRDSRIRRRVDDLDGPASGARHRVLAPEIQLLAKSVRPRPKDDADFAAARPLLTAVERAWLANALALTSPGHPWLET